MKDGRREQKPGETLTLLRHDWRCGKRYQMSAESLLLGEVLMADERALWQELSNPETASKPQTERNEE